MSCIRFSHLRGGHSLMRLFNCFFTEEIFCPSLEEEEDKSSLAPNSYTHGSTPISGLPLEKVSDWLSFDIQRVFVMNAFINFSFLRRWIMLSFKGKREIDPWTSKHAICVTLFHWFMSLSWCLINYDNYY